MSDFTLVSDTAIVFSKGAQVRSIRDLHVSKPTESGEMELVILPSGKEGTIKQVLPYVIVVFEADEGSDSLKEISWHRRLDLSSDLILLVDGKPILKVIK